MRDAADPLSELASAAAFDVALQDGKRIRLEVVAAEALRAVSSLRR